VLHTSNRVEQTTRHRNTKTKMIKIIHVVQYNYTYRVLNKHTHPTYQRGKCKNGKSEIVRTSPARCVNNTHNNNIT